MESRISYKRKKYNITSLDKRNRQKELQVIVLPGVDMMKGTLVQTTLFLLLLWSHAQSTCNTPNRIQRIATQGFLQFIRNSAQIASSSMLLTSAIRPGRTLATEDSVASTDDRCICGVRQCACSVKNDYVSPWYDPSNERIFDTLHGSFIPADSYKYLPKDLRDCRIVAVGEVHSNPV